MKTELQNKLYLHTVEGERRLKLKQTYDPTFQVTDAYRDSLPDMQNAAKSVQGANVAIQQVGISNFKLPLRFLTADGEILTLETSVTGTVSLKPDLKGINMSRIMRTFYEFKDELFTLDALRDILLAYKDHIGSENAELRLRFSYPIVQTSLRSGLTGYQYYDAAFEGRVDSTGVFRKFIHLDFVYSSACPCSAELAEHAREVRDVYGIPHTQRSKARICVELEQDADLTLEEVQQACLRALHTETQVMVKREDEQAFAEMNGATIKFVEDAARLVYEQLDQDPRIKDFEVACAHLESLHSHDAVSVIAKGVSGGFKAQFADFKSLIC